MAITLIGLLAICISSGYSASIQLISDNGNFKTAAQISSFLDKKVSTSLKESLPIVSLIGCGISNIKDLGQKVFLTESVDVSNGKY
jgi:CRISPR/Cas system-associated protein Cas5 (RAMP superfamily)